MENWNWPNVSKDDWGPIGWNWIHLMSIEYKINPIIEDAKLTYKRIWNFIKNIPCVECRTHATRYMILNPPNLHSNISLQIWSFNFHNSVNKRIKKQIMSFKDYQKKYENEITKHNIKF